jgi:hypothetical protein
MKVLKKSADSCERLHLGPCNNYDALAQCRVQSSVTGIQRRPTGSDGTVFPAAQQAQRRLH